MQNEIKSLINERDLLNKQMINAHTIADTFSTSEQQYVARREATKLMPMVGRINKRLRELAKEFPALYKEHHTASTEQWFHLQKHDLILTKETKDAVRRSREAKRVQEEVAEAAE